MRYLSYTPVAIANIFNGITAQNFIDKKFNSSFCDGFFGVGDPYYTYHLASIYLLVVALKIIWSISRRVSTRIYSRERTILAERQTGILHYYYYRFSWIAFLKECEYKFYKNKFINAACIFITIL